ncbi:MAG: AAA family ATPase [Methylobacteriaceae bacterium]|jgi:predicted ATPase|nr:AAA family ATPase [Methylobacteriaceae bacterium]
MTRTPKKLSRVVLRGFRSIRECDVELKALNVLIGGNGAGKSNFLRFFSLVRELMEDGGRKYIDDHGGMDELLHYDRESAPEISAELHFDTYGYAFSVLPDAEGRMDIDGEFFGAARAEDYVRQVTQNWSVYHFPAVTMIKQRTAHVDDNYFLHWDGDNLAAILFYVKQRHGAHYRRIIQTLRSVLPFFNDFVLRPHADGITRSELEWMEHGAEKPLKALQLSDATIRFMCLVTLILQPESLQPDTILIDEPELGLHPFAVSVLGELLRAASKTRQVIISTQSVDLLNEFEADDIIVVDRAVGVTNLRRLDVDALKPQLEEYSLGELWLNNSLGGLPSR